MARPRLSEDTRVRLLDASVAAFLENGYHGTGLKDLLERVGVPKGSFYNYFASKEELGAAAITRYGQGCALSLAAALEAAPDPLAGVRAFFLEQMRGFEQTGFSGGCLLANLTGELDDSPISREALSAAFRGWRDGVRGALADAQRLGSIRGDLEAGELAEMLIEAWEGAVIRMKLEQSTAPLQRCLDRYLDGYLRP